jgi:hypothetical protein
VFVHSTGDVISDQSHCVGLLFKERFSDGKITYKGTDPSCATPPFTTNCIWHGIEPCRVGLNHPASLKLVRSTKPVVWIDALLNGSQLVHIFSKYLSLSVIVRLDFSIHATYLDRTMKLLIVSGQAVTSRVLITDFLRSVFEAFSRQVVHFRRAVLV